MQRNNSFSQEILKIIGKVDIGFNMDRNTKIVAYAMYRCVSSKEDPNDVKMIIEYENDNIKVTTMKSRTKEKTEELICQF